MVEHTMDVSGWLRKQLEKAHPDLLRAMVKEMAEALMSADADAACGAGYGERSPERVNRRNGYRERDWDTRVGSIELAVPKLREGSYFPDWLLQPRRRAEQAFVSVISVKDAPRNGPVEIVMAAAWQLARGGAERLQFCLQRRPASRP